MKMKVNDWVRSYHAGIWRIVREVPEHFEPRFSLEESKELYDGPLLVVKRIVNDKWKTSFEIESVHGSLVRPLTKADTKKLDAFLLNNPDVVNNFEEFDRPLVELLNIGFALERKSDSVKLQKEIAAALGDVSAGVSADVILKAIASSSFATCCGESPQSATLQFVNKNNEIRRRERIYREMKLLKLKRRSGSPRLLPKEFAARFSTLRQLLFELAAGPAISRVLLVSVCKRFCNSRACQSRSSNGGLIRHPLNCSQLPLDCRRIC